MKKVNFRCFNSFYFLLIILILSFSVGCDKSNNISEDNSSQIILGFSQIGAESSWRTANTESIFKAAERNDIQLLFDDAQQKQSNQLKAIRSFIVYQVDVIAFVPIVEDGWDNVLQEAKDAGIPVIIVDRKIHTNMPYNFAGFIGEDSREEGRNAARYLLEKFKDVPGKINILELRGTDNSSVADERSSGFKEILESDNRFEIIYSENGDFLRSRGKEIADQIIAYNGKFSIGGQKINAVYSHNDGMTLGMLESFSEKGYDYKEDGLVIVTVDGEKESVVKLKKGEINCIVQCNPDMGEEIMRLAKLLVQSRPIPAETYVSENVYSDLQDLEKLEYIGF